MAQIEPKMASLAQKRLQSTFLVKQISFFAEIAIQNCLRQKDKT
jgi:hypothetical protein